LSVARWYREIPAAWPESRGVQVPGIHRADKFLIGDEHHQAGAGSVAVVPPDTRHGFRNVADSDSTLEFIVMPGGEIDDYFRRLTALLAGRETDPAALNALGAKYGSIGRPAADRLTVAFGPSLTAQKCSISTKCRTAT
jgi:hypothetical protein